MEENQHPLRRVIVPRRDVLYVRLSLVKNILTGIAGVLLFTLIAFGIYYAYIILDTESTIHFMKAQEVVGSVPHTPTPTTEGHSFKH